MKKTTKVLWAVLCAGVLLMGAGTGMAFATYASFDYDSTSLNPEVNLETEKVKKRIPAEGPIEVCCYWGSAHSSMNVVCDKSVPKDEIRFVVKHDPAYTDIQVDCYKEQEGVLFEVYSIDLVDRFELFMEQKDVILEGLKNDVLIEYNGDDVFGMDVEVRVNPANEDRLICPF